MTEVFKLLVELIPNEVDRKRVLDAIDAQDAMKKYMQTEKGKLAGKRAHEKYVESEKGKKVLEAIKANAEAKATAAREKDYSADIDAFLQKECKDKTESLTFSCSVWWKMFTSSGDFPVTRIQFVETSVKLANVKLVTKWVDINGKKQYSKALTVELKKNELESESDEDESEEAEI
jgi:hypothetical protein